MARLSKEAQRIFCEVTKEISRWPEWVRNSDAFLKKTIIRSPIVDEQKVVRKPRHSVLKKPTARPHLLERLSVSEYEKLPSLSKRTIREAVELGRVERIKAELLVRPGKATSF